MKSHERDAGGDDESVCSSLTNKEERSFEAQLKCLVPTVKVWRDELKQLKVSFYDYSCLSGKTAKNSGN